MRPLDNTRTTREEGNREQGPFCYENWLAQIGGAASRGADEYNLYTDGRPTGQETGEGLDLGPYQLWNAVPVEEGYGLLRPALVLRAYNHIENPVDRSPMERTDVSRFHGGSLSDELAALISLCLGMRLKPGSIVRSFESAEDPAGKPRAEVRSRIPTLSKAERGPIIPGALGNHPLRDAELLQSLPHLTAREANTVVRSARSYQEGLWISEAAPHLAWLFLITAVEIAADHSARGGTSNIELFREQQPSIATRLESDCGEDVLTLVADKFAPTMQATQKFIRFLVDFLPAPPDRRPHTSAQFPWSGKKVREGLSLVYHHRSRALHGGVPMPVPMCEAPWKHERWEAPSEIPSGMATRAAGGTWVAKDTPLLLHTFEYIVRNAILKWWENLALKKELKEEEAEEG